MSKFRTVIEGPWKELELHAESIPNLLHWDFAYLWVLEKERELRPTNWEGRINAWRALLMSLAAGQLNIVEEPIPQPMRNFTEKYGIEAVSWLVAGRGNQKVGVLSPTVLVRPLPDFTDQDLRKVFHPNRIGRFDDEAQALGDQFVLRIINQLREQSAGDSYGARLAEILSREFDVKVESRHRPVSIHHPFPILQSRAWSPSSPYRDGSGGLPIRQIELPIHRGGIKSTFIPYCACGKPLLHKRESEAFVPSEKEVQVYCAHCKQLNVIQLEDLLIWNRQSRGEAYLWEQEANLEPPAKGFPPVPRLQDSEAIFEWDPQLIPGDKTFRFLRLTFPSFKVEQRPISDLLYTKLLVPGELQEGFSGLPIRAEWLGAFDKLEHLRTDVQVPAREVVYRGLRVRGWPQPIRRVYAGDLGLAVEPNLSVGLFPNPKAVCGNWRLFRAFLEGTAARGYEIRTEEKEALQLLPSLIENRAGLPEFLTVELSSARDVGIAFRVTREESGSQEKGEAYLGIDFGTTSTLVYYKSVSDETDSVEPGKHGVQPHQLGEVVSWLAGDGAAVGGTIGAFLPPLKTVEGRIDPYLIPTALWQLDGQGFIRWNQDQPAPMVSAVTNFKWDRPSGQDFSSLRETFLSEVIITTVPLVLEQLALNTVAGVSLKVGVAFPLAFDLKSRVKFDRLLTKIGEELKGMTGLEFDFFSISEAYACIDAFGQANRGEHFLVADFGGSTLDVALYTSRGSGNEPDIHQLGSLEFAGETFIQAFTLVKETDSSLQGEFAWRLRDAILNGQSRHLYGNEALAERVLGRFRASAFEYLRTMVAAFNKKNPGETVRLLLAGNAWHLPEAFDLSSSPETWRAIFQKSYLEMVERINSDTLKLFNSPEMDALPSTKHYVVIGALNNAAGSRRRKHLRVSSVPDGSSAESLRAVQIRLPSGRDLEFTDIGPRQGGKIVTWSGLVGEGAVQTGYSGAELRGAKIDCTIEAMPAASPIWEDYLLSTFKVDDLKDLPYPSPERLRAQIVAELMGDPHGYLAKGPLQLILEKHWKNELTKV